MSLSRLVRTPVGTARVTESRPRAAGGTLVLGHGAGGREWTADVRDVAAAAAAAGWRTVLVDQPWRVAGRRVAPAPATLDAAWLPVLAEVCRAASGPLVVGGRSAGARVACRTATAVGAAAVLCLSFPLHPPGRPERSRAEELRLPVAAGLPVLVLQGARDPFGTPQEVVAAASGPVVTAVPGTHELATLPAPALEAVGRLLSRVG
ncbi:MAG TPA: alpha/beta family hydrolase [Dermatophilaceae bacterium]|nr:alpha/beta family hydrolase [Dermatophilaceae bacterium]